MYRVECECGFAVEGAATEAVAIAQRHASSVHHMELPSGLIEAVSRPIAKTDRAGAPRARQQAMGTLPPDREEHT